MELVSVVIPVYKVERYLERCVDSVRAQTYANLEIILVDDGSPDRCGEICDAYAREDERIRVIHKENGGLSDARNVGAKEGRGKYLLFVDSDDYISEELIQKTVSAAEETGCDMVLFSHFHVEGGRTEVRGEELPSGQPLELKTEKQLLLTAPAAWLKLFRREFYERSGIRFPKGLYYEDLNTMPKFVLTAERIVYLNEPLYYYMVRQDSIMGSKNYGKNYEDMRKVLDDVLKYYKDKGAYETYREELEYLAFSNAYFEPSREIVLADVSTPYLEKARAYIYQTFPDFMKNPYVRRRSRKDRLHMHILNTRQYWLMRLLSGCRQTLEKIRGR